MLIFADKKEKNLCFSAFISVPQGFMRITLIDEFRKWILKKFA
jgi:hypothetical protein